MIRFLPDTFWDFLLRPWYMLLPRNGVYVEITAPDVRVLAVCALLPFVLYALKRRVIVDELRRLMAAVVVFLLALLIWIATTGNGRYFMPFLVIVGPLLVAMVWRLPLSRAMRSFILLLLLVVQAGFVSVNSPWNPSNTFELSAWSNSAPFSLDADLLPKDEDVTYVTVMEQSYSIIAPMLSDRGRWINLRYFEGRDFFGSSHLFGDARRRLSEAKDLRLLVRSFPRSAEVESGLPNGDTLAFLGSYVRPYGMILKPGSVCQVVHSDTLAYTELAVFSGSVGLDVEGMRRHSGFWVCPLSFVGDNLAEEANRLRSSAGGRSIEKMERICPTYFPAGQMTFRHEGGELVRYYPSSDVRLIYSEANRKLFAKFTFALNPVLLGDAEDIAADSFSYDCRRFVRWE